MTRILSAEDIQGRLIRKVLRVRGGITLSDYQHAHARYVVTQPGAPQPHTSALSLVMAINHGRWVVDCPECHGGVTTFLDAPEARCWTCGAIFRHVVWPDRRRDIERVLLQRLPIHRNWTPTETLDQLIADNLRFGAARLPE
jgi:hypothetical protein